MKVTFVALNYAPSRGGAQEHVRRVAEGLVARGHDVTVLTTDAMRSPSAREPGSIGTSHEVIGQVEVQRFVISRAVTSAQRYVRLLRARLRRAGSPAAARPWGPALIGPWSLGMVQAIRRAIRSSDVVVGCSAPFATLVLPARFTSSGRARIASMPLLHLTEAGPHPAVVRALLRSDLVVSNTEYEADATRELGVPADKVRVIPPGVAPADFPAVDAVSAREQAGLPERPTVGFIGRIAAYKGVDTLLDAAPAIWDAHPDTTLLIAGSATGWDGFRSDAVAQRGGDRLVIREDFAAAERSLLFSACDIVVHPSRDESFGLIAVEAWAARRPVVLADIPCIRTFVDAGRTAEMIAPGDDVALAETIIELLGDPARRDRMAAAGRAEVEARFDWEHVCDAWDEALRRLVDEDR